MRNSEIIDDKIADNSPKHSNGGDAGIGILCGLAYSLIVWILGGLLNYSIGYFVIAVLIYIVGVFLAFFKNRNYIGIGLLIILAIPLIIFGGCALILTNLKI
jgi:hypothetical protein